MCASYLAVILFTSYLNFKLHIDMFLCISFSAQEAGITVMNEIGVDPGIDHLYAKKIIDEMHEEGSKVSLN